MTRTRVAELFVAIAVGAVALTVTLTQGCGSKPGRASGRFAWLQPASPPSGWNVAVTQAGAALAYPPGWMPSKTDPWAASAALLAGGGSDMFNQQADTLEQAVSSFLACASDRPRLASYHQIHDLGR